jgi:hypothetical protein
MLSCAAMQALRPPDALPTQSSGGMVLDPLNALWPADPLGALLPAKAPVAPTSPSTQATLPGPGAPAQQAQQGLGDMLLWDFEFAAPTQGSEPAPGVSRRSVTPTPGGTPAPPGSRRHRRCGFSGFL